MNVIDAIKKRASIRAFLSKPVSDEILQQILDAARWTASDKNSQPWYVAVVTGDAKQALANDLVELNTQRVEPNPDFPIEPSENTIYKDRAFQCGVDLYKALAIERKDKDKRIAQWQKNFKFFDAPVGLFFFTEADLGIKACVDTAMLIQSVMLAAMEFELGTCAQGAMAFYPDTVRQYLGEKFHDKKLICGMSLGYPDCDAAENNYRTERASLDEFVTFFN